MLIKEAGSQVAQHEEQIKGALGALAGFVNEQTGGRYTEQVGKATDFVEQGVDLLVANGRDQGGPPSSPPSSPQQPPPTG